MDQVEKTEVAVINTIAAPVARTPEFTLVVIHPFGDYRRGDAVTDAAEIESVIQSENAHHCHKVLPQ
jgi:hypothetical protein